MSLRILFADDSVTAQNMGKKILTEAGYEVVAVSNGAAAVKKIAELKPDIIILDVYMPGYSGLEVCEKVRSNIATIKTPVLLTVGKMEPYKPEDANRVRADGVIIKPFEASDLLAIIKKFEERIKNMPAPPAPPPPLQRKAAVDLYPEPETPEPVKSKVMQPMVEVPDHMASSSAFSDLLGSDSSHAMPQFATAPAAVPQADETARLSALPDYEVPLSWRQENEPQPMTLVSPPESKAAAPVAEEAPAPVAVSEPEPVSEPAPETEILPVTEVAMGAPPSPVIAEPEAPEHTVLETIATSIPASIPVAEAAPEEAIHETATDETASDVSTVSEPVTASAPVVRPIKIPMYQDPAPTPAEFMPTASAPIGDIDVPREPALQESAEEITRATVADAREADLVPTSHAVQEANIVSVPTHTAASADVAEMTVGSPDLSPADLPEPQPMVMTQSPELAVEASPAKAHPTADAAAVEHAAPTLTNDDFEARVAAAMAAYGQNQPASATANEGGASRNGSSDVTASDGASAIGVAAPPAVEEPAPVYAVTPAPVVEAAKSDVDIEEHKKWLPEAAAVAATQAAAPVEVTPAAIAETVTAKVEAELPDAAHAIAQAAEASGAEHHNIAQVVHRVMERMKGDLVEEIVRELKAKK